MALEGIIVKHLEHMRVRNLRPTTVYGRQRTLARLSVWAGGPVLYLSDEDLSRWQLERSRDLDAGSLRGETSHVRQFYRWAVLERYRADDPTAHLPMPRVARRLPRPMPDAAIARAIAAGTAEQAVIIGLAAFAGLRACEISRLDWSEVGLTDGTRQIRIVEGKGGYGRIVPLAPVLAELLAALPHRRGPVVQRSDSHRGHVRPWTVSRRINEYLHGVGVPETLHQCRHRFATATYAGCRDIRAVQDLLGHRSPTTTAQYAATPDGSAVQAVNAAGVLADAA